MKRSFLTLLVGVTLAGCSSSSGGNASNPADPSGSTPKVAVPQSAAGGSEGVGGGDLCEDRIKIIRDDIHDWINKGGPQGLQLPTGLAVSQYSSKMLGQLDKAKIACVGPGDSRRGDCSYPIMVGNTPKTCKFTLTADSSQVCCDFEKFKETSESDQYVLVHHEFAGLAGIEPPDADSSNYSVSNQLTGYLEEQTIKKLVVHPVAPTNPPSMDLSYSIQDLPSGTVLTFKILPTTIPVNTTTYESCHTAFGSLRMYFQASSDIRTFNGAEVTAKVLPYNAGGVAFCAIHDSLSGDVFISSSGAISYVGDAGSGTVFDLHFNQQCTKLTLLDLKNMLQSCGGDLTLPPPVPFHN